MIYITNVVENLALEYKLVRFMLKVQRKYWYFWNKILAWHQKIWPVLENLVGLGTGSLKEHFNVLKKARVPIYVSAISCEIRGVSAQDLKDSNARKVFQLIWIKYSFLSN